MEELYGYIERITFQNPENGYTVAQLKQRGYKDTTCIVGFFTSVQPGETIRCKGMWKNHLIHGKQFEVESYQVEAPADILGIKKYLGSGLIKGIGSVYANRIVEKFGIATLDVIDKEPSRLEEIEGLGKKRCAKIRECWQEQKSIREVMIFLQAHGVSPTYAQKIFKRYGSKSIAVVQQNPFQLARDIFGIGFRTADKISENLGISKQSPSRVDAGIEFFLSEQSSEGHVCFPEGELILQASSLLEVDKELVTQRVLSLQKENRIEKFYLAIEGEGKDFIWNKALFLSEIGISREIKRLIHSKCTLRSINVDKALPWVEDQLKIELASKQKEAVAKAIESKFLVITGGPGTGKSTITKAILHILDKLTGQILLAAPTGKAAKRMGEITKRKASTIHSLLEFDFKGEGFKRNRDNPLECDLLIVDEASMIDTMLMYNLLKAIPSHARVILVGDINQLPSVGPGNVLKDIINSLTVPVIVLNEIFRQAAGSKIITNAHRIIQGQMPEIHNVAESDFFFVEAQDPQEILHKIIQLVSIRIPQKYKMKSFEDIQVLSPMRKGVIGVQNLNMALQSVLNPKENALFRSGQKFLVGDKVMQIRNNYQKEVFNGDTGRIIDIDFAEQMILVEMDDKEVSYDFSDLDELVLAYAVSVHKYQGSERKCIVMPIDKSQFMLLNRNLIYTGVTRGKELVILVGRKDALAMGVRNDEVKKRYTGLQQALIGNLF